MLRFVTKTHSGYLGELYAESWEQAERYCPPNAKVVGLFVCEINTNIDIEKMN